MSISVSSKDPNTPTEFQTGSMESESTKLHLFASLHPSVPRPSERNDFTFSEVHFVFSFGRIKPSNKMKIPVQTGKSKNGKVNKKLLLASELME